MPKVYNAKPFVMFGLKGPVVANREVQTTVEAGINTLAKERRHSKRSKSGSAMSPSLNFMPRVPRQAVASSLPASQHESPGHIEQSASNTQPAPAFYLTTAQQAQISQAVFEQNQIGATIVGKDGRIQHANRAFADLLHYKEDELVGRALDDLLRTPEEARDSERETNVLPDGPELPVVRQLTRKTGEKVSCFIDSHPIRNEDGQIIQVLIFVAEAQSPKEAEESERFEVALYQSQALQTLGMLTAGVAHDFNNALEVIMGFASLARIRLSPSDPLYEPLKIIEESATGAARLVRQLLDVSKDKSDGEQDINVGDLINSVTAIISRTFDRKIRIEHRIEPRLPCVRGIRSRLEQAILNLCLNAREAMPQGGVLALNASSEGIAPADHRPPTSTTRHGEYVKIAVRDTGTGMRAEIIEKIFVPLFTTKGPGQGSGLGLAMVDRIIKEAQGFISVASEPGEGSEFSLYLPAGRRALRGTHPQPGRLVSGRGMILAVDDEPRILEFLEKGLTRLGYEVVSAESGAQACEIYSRRCSEINCVLLDLIMPGMSGLDTYGRLRDINPSVRVILSSGYSSGRSKGESVEAGSPEFLEKPYTLQELSVALQKIKLN